MLQMPAPQQNDHSPPIRVGGGYLDDEAYAYASGKARPSQPRNPVLKPAAMLVTGVQRGA